MGDGMDVPRSRTRRKAPHPVKKLWIAALVVLGVVAPACGGKTGETSATPVQLVRAAAGETATSTMRATFKVTGGGLPAEGVTMDAEYDLDERRARVEIPADAFGGNGSIVEIVDFSDGLVMWLQMPGAAQEIGAEWLEIDASKLGALGSELGFDVDSLLSQAEQNDPTSGLDALRGAKTVDEIGREDVRGESTTHHLVTVDLDDAIEAAPEESRDALRNILSKYASGELQMDVWIDDEGRVRRYRQTVDPADVESLPSGGGPAGPVTVEFEFYDFGADVDVVPPADEDTVSFTDLAGLFGSN
jgi:hypothetical protein